MAKEMEKPMHFKEVKEFLGKNSDFVYKELQKGHIIGRKLGKEWIVYPSDLKRYLDNLPSNQRKIRLS